MSTHENIVEIKYVSPKVHRSRIFRPAKPMKLPLSKLRPRDNLQGRIYMTVVGEGLFDRLEFPEGCLLDGSFNVWVSVFHDLLRELSAGEESEYEYPYPDQGQPEFRFLRHSDQLTIAVEDCREFEGVSRKHYELHCLYQDFVDEVNRFLSSVKQLLVSASPRNGLKWWERTLRVMSAS